MTYKIYKISSDYSSKLYIGQTKRSLEERFREHCIPPNNESEFSSYVLRHICQQYGLSQRNLTEVISGKRKQHKGWKVSKIQ